MRDLEYKIKLYELGIKEAKVGKNGFFNWCKDFDICLQRDEWRLLEEYMKKTNWSFDCFNFSFDLNLLL